MAVKSESYLEVFSAKALKPDVQGIFVNLQDLDYIWGQCDDSSDNDDDEESDYEDDNDDDDYDDDDDDDDDDDVTDHHTGCDAVHIEKIEPVVDEAVSVPLKIKV